MPPVSATVIHHGHIAGPFNVDRLTADAARLIGGHVLSSGAALVVVFQHADLGRLPVHAKVVRVASASIDVALSCASLAALRLLEFMEAVAKSG